MKDQIKNRLKDTIELQRAEIGVLKDFISLLKDGEIYRVINRINDMITNKQHNTNLLEKHIK